MHLQRFESYPVRPSFLWVIGDNVEIVTFAGINGDEIHLFRYDVTSVQGDDVEWVSVYTEPEVMGAGCAGETEAVNTILLNKKGFQWHMAVFGVCGTVMLVPTWVKKTVFHFVEKILKVW